MVVGSKNAGAGEASEVPVVSASSDSSSDDTDLESAVKPRRMLTRVQHFAKGRRYERNLEAARKGKTPRRMGQRPGWKREWRRETARGVVRLSDEERRARRAEQRQRKRSKLSASSRCISDEALRDMTTDEISDAYERCARIASSSRRRSM